MTLMNKLFIIIFKHRKFNIFRLNPNKQNAIGILLILFILFSYQLPLYCNTPYSRIIEVFSKYDHRLPGSVGYYKCIDAIEKELKNMGLFPYKQTFDTLVPKTKKCEFIVDGKKVTLYPLAPDEQVPVTTDGKVLKGPLVYAGNGTLEELNNKPIKGAIVILNMGTPNMETLFSEGSFLIRIFRGCSYWSSCLR